MSKTNKLSVPVSCEIASFAVVMETKLQADGYGDPAAWKGIELAKIVRKMDDVVRRLGATDPSDSKALFTRAVILGNLAMMVAEKSASAEECRQASQPMSAGGDLPRAELPRGVLPRGPFRHRVKAVSRHSLS